MARSDDSNVDTAEAQSRALIGRAIGKYTLVRVIGRGGMGIVFEAQNTTIGKRVAVKLVSTELSKNRDAVIRFQREAQAASAVESAHIVDIFDAGTTDNGVPYIVMELLRGEDLGHRIRRMGRLDLEDALKLTFQILRGLARAHAAGIIHRDLKPDNIFLVDRDDDDSFVKILDFGISKVARTGETPVQTLTKEGTVLGTPFYMAPEQAQSLPDIDGRADLWSVGAILYECLTGRAPHTGASYEQVIVNICSKDADDVRLHNPGVPEDVANVLRKALERSPEVRFQSAREFSEAVAHASDGALTLASRSSDEPLFPSSGGRVSRPSGSAQTPLDQDSLDSDGRPVVSSARRPSVRSERNSANANVRTEKPFGSVPSSGHPASGAFEDTVEMRAGGPSRNVGASHPSATWRLGWATNGATAAGRDKRRVAAVLLSALMITAVLVAIIARRPASQVAGRPDELGATDAPTSEVTLKLRANVEGARFLVDGRQIAGGVLRGAKGETKKVTVEAEGYAAIEAIVTFEPGQELPPLYLSPKMARSPGSATPASTTAPEDPSKLGAKQPVFRSGAISPSTVQPGGKPGALAGSDAPPTGAGAANGAQPPNAIPTNVGAQPSNAIPANVGAKPPNAVPATAPTLSIKLE